MRTYKRLTLFLFVAFVGVILWRAFGPYYQDMSSHKSWTTYEKKNGSVEARKTTTEEKVNLKLPEFTQTTPVKDIKRAPTSVAPAKSFYLGREITGPFSKDFEKNKSRYTFKNTVASDW